MKKIIIKCISNYSLSGKYHIIILNKFCDKVYDECTKYGRTELYLNTDVYKIIIIPFDIYSSILSTNFILTNEINYYNFFIRKNDNSLKITAILVDENYNNLPIERGEITLWQNHIQ